MPKPKSDQEYRTPKWLFDYLEKHVVGRKFLLDAAASPHNALCKRYFTKEQNALKRAWAKITFCNPPFKRFGDWIRHGYGEALLEKTVCLVGPVGCSQSWFHEFARRGTIFYPNQRISFCDSKTGEQTGGADRDHMIYVFGPSWWNEDWSLYIRGERLDVRAILERISK